MIFVHIPGGIQVAGHGQVQVHVHTHGGGNGLRHLLNGLGDGVFVLVQPCGIVRLRHHKLGFAVVANGLHRGRHGSQQLAHILGLGLGQPNQVLLNLLRAKGLGSLNAKAPQSGHRPPRHTVTWRGSVALECSEKIDVSRHSPSVGAVIRLSSTPTGTFILESLPNY
jgi:hypothetical protein